MTRLVSSDLAILGTYLFGPRWQCQMARAIKYSARQVRYWAAGDRPVSITASRRIEVLVRTKHGEHMRRTRALYLDMVASLSHTGIRERLLLMDLGALRVDDQLRRASITAPRANGTAEPPNAVAPLRDAVLPRLTHAAYSLLAAGLCAAVAVV